MSDRRKLDPLQASLVFINTCFGFAFASLLVVVDDWLRDAPLQHIEKMWWFCLPTYVILLVWIQYRSYYIPFQQIRNELDTTAEEAVTYLITLWLGIIGIASYRIPEATPALLVVLIMLVLLKTHQMKSALRRAPAACHVAAEEIDRLTRRLWINLVLFVFLVLALYELAAEFSKAYFAFGAGALTVSLHFLLAATIYENFEATKQRPLAHYLKSLELWTSD